MEQARVIPGHRRGHEYNGLLNQPRYIVRKIYRFYNSKTPVTQSTLFIKEYQRSQKIFIIK